MIKSITARQTNHKFLEAVLKTIGVTPKPVWSKKSSKLWESVWYLHHRQSNVRKHGIYNRTFTVSLVFHASCVKMLIWSVFKVESWSLRSQLYEQKIFFYSSTNISEPFINVEIMLIVFLKYIRCLIYEISQASTMNLMIVYNRLSQCTLNKLLTDKRCILYIYIFITT